MHFRACTKHTSGYDVISGHVTSCVVISGQGSFPLLPPKYAMSCPDILLWYLDLGGTLLITHEKYIKDGKVLAHLGFKSKILPERLTDLGAWVGFCTSSPKQGVKYQLWYLDLGGDPMNIPWKITETRQSSLLLGIQVNGITQAFNWRKCLGGIMHLKPTAGCQISALIFGFGGDPIHIPWIITEGRQSSLPLGREIKGIVRIFNWLNA
jgi:hypothetical protein